MILNLYLNTYNGFNVSHFGEFLKEAHGIDVSRETLRNLLLTLGLGVRLNLLLNIAQEGLECQRVYF